MTRLRHNAWKVSAYTGPIGVIIVQLLTTAGLGDWWTLTALPVLLVIIGWAVWQESKHDAGISVCPICLDEMELPEVALQRHGWALVHYHRSAWTVIRLNLIPLALIALSYVLEIPLVGLIGIVILWGVVVPMASLAGHWHRYLWPWCPVCKPGDGGGGGGPDDGPEPWPQGPDDHAAQPDRVHGLTSKG